MQAEEGDQRSERAGRRVLQDRAARAPGHGGADRLHGRGRDAGDHPRRDTPPKGRLGFGGETALAKVEEKAEKMTRGLGNNAAKPAARCRLFCEKCKAEVFRDTFLNESGGYASGWTLAL